MKNIKTTLFAFSLVLCLAGHANAQCSTGWSYSNYQSCSFSHSPMIYNSSYSGCSYVSNCQSYSPVIYNSLPATSNFVDVISTAKPVQSANTPPISVQATPVSSSSLNLVPVGNNIWRYSSPSCQGGNCAFR